MSIFSVNNIFPLEGDKGGVHFHFKWRCAEPSRSRDQRSVPLHFKTFTLIYNLPQFQNFPLEGDKGGVHFHFKWRCAEPSRSRDKGGVPLHFKPSYPNAGIPLFNDYFILILFLQAIFFQFMYFYSFKL